jgi:hypothetical protein
LRYYWGDMCRDLQHDAARAECDQLQRVQLPREEEGSTGTYTPQFQPFPVVTEIRKCPLKIGESRKLGKKNGKKGKGERCREVELAVKIFKYIHA